ncbi:MAG: ABC transporter permease [Chloroflexi bacterium]|nr:ABC transporter permease [Chloroflexota bacterium]MCL5108819.1 ABC transporter permease [Chloroflexota bacterium]
MATAASASRHSGGGQAGPSARRRAVEGALHNRLVFLGLTLGLVFVFMALLPNLLTPADPYKMNVSHAMAGPTSENWLGTDNFGRDVWTRIVYGSRSSLGIAFASVSVACSLGTLLGLLAGYFGKTVDQVFGRLMDIFFSFPSLLLAIIVAGILGPSMQNVILAITVVYTPFFFRVARGPTLVEKEREYILAARTLGASAPRILLRHVLPNILAPVVVQASVTLCYAILTEASLSYLGLGIQPPHPSWGSILNEGRPYLQIAPWISVFPGLTIMLAVLAFNLLGDGLRDLWDPRNV